jgi:hypothetical protein
MHLPATVYRASNTILTASALYTDKMDKLTLPDTVKDNYNEWIEKGFVTAVKDQMLCGGCWAFAACSSLADRLTIATAGRWHEPFGLSEQVLISCGEDMGMDFYQGCQGGIPHFAIDSLTKEGIPADIKCLDCGGRPDGGGEAGDEGGTSRGGGVVNPNNTNTCAGGGNIYAATDYTWWQTGCDGNTSCSLVPASTCPCGAVLEQMKQVDQKANLRYRTIGEAHNYTSHGENNEIHTVDLWPNIPQSVIDANVERMKKAIYYEGPITVGYRVTSDFYSYWPTATVDNYYRYDNRSAMAGGHAVVIVGWKKMADGTPVWIVKNSWGANGGYGFPDGSKTIDSATGKFKPKYLGGFWNHIMGINDSFIESNAVGAHPDLKVPQISEHLPQGGAQIPAEWNKTLTLRDIYNATKMVNPSFKPPRPEPTPTPTPVPTPTPTPTPTPVPVPEPSYKPDPLLSNRFDTVTLTTDNITPESIAQFFSDDSNLYMIGSNHSKILYRVMEILPRKANLSSDDLSGILERIGQDLEGYLIIAAKGDMNNYYYIEGDPVDWTDSLHLQVINRAATMRKFSHDIFWRLQNLDTHSPIVQLSVKTENFYNWIK